MAGLIGHIGDRCKSCGAPVPMFAGTCSRCERRQSLNNEISDLEETRRLRIKRDVLRELEDDEYGI